MVDIIQLYFEHQWLITLNLTKNNAHLMLACQINYSENKNIRILDFTKSCETKTCSDRCTLW